jgi:putative endonuclease
MEPTPRHPPHALGAWGERVACTLLRRGGWLILERGYRLGRREIDVIARRGALLAFVEVKTRSTDAFGRPEEAVTRRKRREIETVALDYLARHVREDVSVRFDVVSVLAGPGHRLLRCEHLEDAWRPER